MSPSCGSAATVSTSTTARLGSTAPARRLRSETLPGPVWLAGKRVRYVVAVGAIAVRLAMIATTGRVENKGTPACPATVIRRWRAPAPTAPVAHDVETTRVSQIRVGTRA